MASKEKEQRTTTKRQLTLERKRLMHTIEHNYSMENINGSYSVLGNLWQLVKEKHEVYLQSLNIDSESEEHDSWINEMSVKFSEAEEHDSWINETSVKFSESEEHDSWINETSVKFSESEEHDSWINETNVKFSESEEHDSWINETSVKV